MSENNARDEARVLLKKITEFNITNEYYQKEKKEEIARDLRQLLFIDNTSVRQFLNKWLVATKSVAQEFDLLGSEVEVQKADEEETQAQDVINKEETEEVEQSDKQEEQPTETKPEDEQATEEKPNQVKMPESSVYYRNYLNRASELTIDLLND